ncbi:hypothetical protein AB0K14_04160 [Actinosynnema sp. NPDC050801]
MITGILVAAGSFYSLTGSALATALVTALAVTTAVVLRGRGRRARR